MVASFRIARCPSNNPYYGPRVLDKRPRDENRRRKTDNRSERRARRDHPQSEASQTCDCLDVDGAAIWGAPTEPGGRPGSLGRFRLVYMIGFSTWQAHASFLKEQAKRVSRGEIRAVRLIAWPADKRHVTGIMPQIAFAQRTPSWRVLRGVMTPRPTGRSGTRRTACKGKSPAESGTAVGAVPARSDTETGSPTLNKRGLGKPERGRVG